MSFDNTENRNTNEFEMHVFQTEEENDLGYFNQIEPDNQPKVNIIHIFQQQQNYSNYQSNSYSTSELDTTLQETIINLSPKIKKNPLLQFIDNPNSKMKVGKRKSQKPRKKPKKDYYRMKLIRRFMKSLNIFFNRPDDPINMIADDYNDFLSKNGKTLKYAIEVDLGLKLNRDSKNSSSRFTMNDTFCKKFFSDDMVFEGFKIFVERIFSDNEENLCKMFQFNCCEDRYHQKQCMDMWTILKIWTKSSLIRFDPLI